MYLFRMSLAILLLLISVNAYCQSEFEELDWQYGPVEVSVGSEATIDVPDGYMFLGAEDSRILMEMMQNIPTGNEHVLAPVDFYWFAVLEFDEVGYVRDDDELVPSALLETVTRGTEMANEQRRSRGWSTMSILGWRFEPRYDAETRLLEWAFRARVDESQEEIINYNTRLLGRTGVMQVVVVADPIALEQAVSDFKQAIAGFAFTPGHRYADYRQGDRVAEFGLAALIAGGAAAVAQKKGFWALLAGMIASMWKALAAVVIAALAWVSSLFKRKSGSDV